MNPPTNKKSVEILKWFQDHRGNRIAPGVYAPGTMLQEVIDRLNNSQYRILDKNSKPLEPKVKQKVLNESTTVVKKMVQTVPDTSPTESPVEVNLNPPTRGKKTNTATRKAPRSAIDEMPVAGK